MMHKAVWELMPTACSYQASGPALERDKDGDDGPCARLLRHHRRLTLVDLRRERVQPQVEARQHRVGRTAPARLQAPAARLAGFDRALSNAARVARSGLLHKMPESCATQLPLQACTLNPAETHNSKPIEHNP
jgi:hypothetical protein